MADTKVVDWRVWKAGTVAAPAVLPSGRRVEAGEVFHVVSHVRDSRGMRVWFATPSAVSLALSIAINAAHTAVQLRTQLSLRTLPDGTQDVEDASIPRLFSYFEQCMIAVTFSFQALETFANQIVDENLKAPLDIARGAEVKQWDADAVQRNCTTEEKLSDVLPRLGPVRSPKGKRPWEGFKKLKRLRDSNTHVKGPDQYIRDKEDKQSLYYRFMNHDPREYVRWSLAMLRHYVPTGEDGRDAWLRNAEDRLNNPNHSGDDGPKHL